MAGSQADVRGIALDGRNEYERWFVGTGQLKDIIAGVAKEKGGAFDAEPPKVKGIDCVVGTLTLGEETYVISSAQGEGRYGGPAMVLYNLNGRRIQHGNGRSRAAEVLETLRSPIAQALADEEQEVLKSNGITEWPDSDP